LCLWFGDGGAAMDVVAADTDVAEGGAKRAGTGERDQYLVCNVWAR